MGINLSKGSNVSLAKADPSMTRLSIGLGWDARSTDGADFDLDASAFLLKSDGKVRNDSDFVFYNNLTCSDGCVTHTGDNLTGDADGDDEVIIVDLPLVPADVEKIVFTVTIHDADKRAQTFGQVSNAFIRVVNDETHVEAARFDLTEDASSEVAMIFGELYRFQAEWKFRAVGQGFAGGLAALVKHFGLNPVA